MLILYGYGIFFIEGERLSCTEQAQKAASSNLVGAFVPRCQPDGNFAPLQCYGSTGVCWCVNKYGEKVPDALIPKTKCSMSAHLFFQIENA